MIFSDSAIQLFIKQEGMKMNLDKIVEKDFQGCISIKQNGRNIFQNAYGYADLPNKVPNTLETRFATASAGKVFVAVAILSSF